MNSVIESQAEKHTGEMKNRSMGKSFGTRKKKMGRMSLHTQILSKRRFNATRESALLHKLIVLFFCHLEMSLSHTSLSFSKSQKVFQQEPTETSKQPIRTRYLGHVTGYQPIRDQYFLIRSILYF
eukprot:sb/3475699/